MWRIMLEFWWTAGSDDWLECGCFTAMTRCTGHIQDISSFLMTQQCYRRWHIKQLSHHKDQRSLMTQANISPSSWSFCPLHLQPDQVLMSSQISWSWNSSSLVIDPPQLLIPTDGIVDYPAQKQMLIMYSFLSSSLQSYTFLCREKCYSNFHWNVRQHDG